MAPSTKILSYEFLIVLWVLTFYDLRNNTKIHVEAQFGLSSTFRSILADIKTWNFTIFT